MNKTAGILVIHGIGAQAPAFAEEMIEEINERVADKGKNPDRLAWETVFWADVLEARQTAYLRAAKRRGPLDYMELRRFVVNFLGDASAYQRIGPSSAADAISSATSGTYVEIHNRVRAALRRLYEVQLNSESKPLLVLAHSLGGHIISNYIWDIQSLRKRGQADGLSAFERLETLTGFITFGSNIPLFTFAYETVIPIAFPDPQLPAELKDKAKWLNFYDPDDILAYPLKPINEAYDQVVTADVAINVGGLFASWNPLSHIAYWTDNDFTKPVSEFIAGFA